MPSDNIKFYEPNAFDLSNQSTAITKGNPQVMAGRVLDVKNREPVRIINSSTQRQFQTIEEQETLVANAVINQIDGIDRFTNQPASRRSLSIGDIQYSPDRPANEPFVLGGDPPWTQETLERSIGQRGNRFTRIRSLREYLKCIFIADSINDLSIIKGIPFLGYTSNTLGSDDPAYGAFAYLSRIRINGFEIRVETGPNEPPIAPSALSSIVQTPSSVSKLRLRGQTAPEILFRDLPDSIKSMPNDVPFTVFLNFFYIQSDPLVDTGYIFATEPETQTVTTDFSGAIEVRTRENAPAAEGNTIILRGAAGGDISIGTKLSGQVQGPSDISVKMNVRIAEVDRYAMFMVGQVVDSYRVGSHNFGTSLLTGNPLFQRTLNLSHDLVWNDFSLNRNFDGLDPVKMAKILEIRNRFRGVFVPSVPRPVGTFPGAVVGAVTEEPPGTPTNTFDHMNLVFFAAEGWVGQTASGEADFQSVGRLLASQNTRLVQSAELFRTSDLREPLLFEHLSDYIRNQRRETDFIMSMNFNFTRDDPIDGILLDWEPEAQIESNLSEFTAYKDNRFDPGGTRTVGVASVVYRSGDDVVAGQGNGTLEVRFTEPITTVSLLSSSAINYSARINNYMTNSVPIIDDTAEGTIIGFRAHISHEVRDLIRRLRPLNPVDDVLPIQFEFNLNFAYRRPFAGLSFEEENNFVFRGPVDVPALPRTSEIESVIPHSVKTSFSDTGDFVYLDGAVDIPRPTGSPTPPTTDKTTFTSPAIRTRLTEHEHAIIKIREKFPIGIAEIGKSPGFESLNQELKSFIFTEGIGELKGFPEIKQFPFNQNETKVKTKDGRFFVNKQRETVRSIDLRGRNYAEIEDIEFLRELLNRDFPFLIWPNGGHQDFRFLIPGFDPQDFFKVQTLGQFRVGLAKGSYRGLMNFKIRFVESV